MSPQELLAFEEADCGRIADRLHDDVLQALGCSLLKAELSKGLLARGATRQAEQAIDELRDQLDAVVQELRTLMMQVRPYKEHPLGLQRALESYLRGYPAGNGARIESAVEVAEEPPPAAAALLYRVLREALAEVVDYRRFGTVNVQVAIGGGSATLRLQATQPRQAPAARPPGDGRDLGWRARLVGGESTVHDLADRLEWALCFPTGQA